MKPIRSLHLAVLATIACAAILSSCNDKGDDPEPTPDPVVTITKQPASATSVTEGSITGTLTVAATVTEGATLSYQWYTNTSASNAGGNLLLYGTNASLTIPTGLKAGDHYFYCEVSATGGAVSVTSDVARVSVALARIVPAPITGIVAPVAGANPNTTIDNGEGYTATLWNWVDEENNEVSGPFASGKVYKAYVTLEAKDGYTFAGVALGDLQGFLPSGAVSLEGVGGNDNLRILYITYPATGVSNTGSGDNFTSGGGVDW